MGSRCSVICTVVNFSVDNNLGTGSKRNDSSQGVSGKGCISGLTAVNLRNCISRSRFLISVELAVKSVANPSLLFTVPPCRGVTIEDSGLIVISYFLSREDSVIFSRISIYLKVICNAVYFLTLDICLRPRMGLGILSI